HHEGVGDCLEVDWVELETGAGGQLLDPLNITAPVVTHAGLSRALWSLALGREEVPHGAPDIVEVVECIAARGAARSRQLREQPSGLRGELPRQTGRNLHVPGVARVPGNRRERLTRIRGVAQDRKS